MDTTTFLIFNDIVMIFFSSQVREDPVFRREGSNIHVDAVLSVTQVKTFLYVFYCSIQY